MATFLNRTDPWIESTFLYAASFDPDIYRKELRGGGGGGGHVDVVAAGRGGGLLGGAGAGGGSNDEEEGGREEEEEQEQEEEAHSSTEDTTIPPGLLPPKRGPNDVPPPPVSRRSKFAQVIHAGGDMDYYRASRRNGGDDNSTMPPHLVVHDGEYSAIVILSPETCEAYLLDYNNNDDVDNPPPHPLTLLPPRRSLVALSGYTVSTVLRCCLRRLPIDPPTTTTAPPPHPATTTATTTPPPPSASDGNNSPDATPPLPAEVREEVRDADVRRIALREDLDAHSRILSSLLFTHVPHRGIVRGLRRRRRDDDDDDDDAAPAPAPPRQYACGYQLIPTELQEQLASQVPDIRLCMCLYLRGGPVTCVGAENGGLIGDPVDVHCSVALRRELMRHRRLHGDDDDYDDDDDDDGGPSGEWGEGGGEGHSHSVLIRRLEAVHRYYRLLDRRQQMRRHRPLPVELAFGNNGGGDGDGDGDDRGDDDDDDDRRPDGAERRRRRRGGKKRYGKRNRGGGGGRHTGDGGRGGGRGGGRDGVNEDVGRRGGQRAADDGNDDDWNAASAAPDEDAAPEWPWESRLAVDPSPFNERGRFSGAIGGRIGGGASSTAATAGAYGDVNDLFGVFQDIDDALGLDDAMSSAPPAIAPANNRDDDAMLPRLWGHAARPAAGGDVGTSSAANDDGNENDTDDRGGGEIDEVDSALSFVGIDDMIIDEDDDSDEGGMEDGGDPDDDETDHRKMNRALDEETQRISTQPPEAEGAARGCPDENGDDADEHGMAEEFDNPESQIIIPSYPVGRASKKKINEGKPAAEREMELEMDPKDRGPPSGKRRKSKKKAAARRRPRDDDGGDLSDAKDDRRGSQIPLHLRKAPPETLGLHSAAARHRDDGMLEGSQTSLPRRKPPMEPTRWTEEEGGVEKEVRGQESQISFTRNMKKRNVAEGQHRGEKRTEVPNANTTSATRTSRLVKEPTGRNEHQERVTTESQLPLERAWQQTSRTALQSSQRNHDSSDDSSDKWMRVRRCDPRSRSRSLASPPKQMMTHPAATAAAAAASDESTESLFETQQQSGEGSEESVPPPPPLQPTISSSRKEPSAATTTTTYLQEDGTDDTVAQQLMGSIREEEDVREMILNAPWIPPNNRSPAHGGGNRGGPDHHRVRFDIDRNNNTVVNCEMSSISAKAAIILGLSTSPTRTDSLPQGDGSRQRDNTESVARNKRKRKARKQFDIAQVIERAKGLHGL